MKKFLIRILIFFIPVVFYFSLVALADPYSFFPESDFISNEAKENVSFKLNYPLYKLIRYSNNPIKNIILGDSRAKSLNVDVITQCSNKEFANLAYGGGSLQEVIDTFWEISKNNTLETVAIGVNFDLYNSTNNFNRVPEAINLKNNFFSYASSKYVFKSIAVISKMKLLNEPFTVGIPEMTNQEFWDYQLNSAANNVYRIYKYPQSYFDELELIKQYCTKNNIELVFFIPPTHVDLQNKIKEFELIKEQEKFKSDLKSLGAFYDFDYPNEVTTNKANFDDPYHCNELISELLVKTIFCKKREDKQFSEYYKFD